MRKLCIRRIKDNKSRQAKQFAYGSKAKPLGRGLAKQDRVKKTEFWVKNKPKHYKNLGSISNKINIFAYKVIETNRNPDKPFLWATYKNLVLLKK